MHNMAELDRARCILKVGMVAPGMEDLHGCCPFSVPVNIPIYLLGHVPAKENCGPGLTRWGIIQFQMVCIVSSSGTTENTELKILGIEPAEQVGLPGGERHCALP